jgi:hypothetical protein
LNSLDLFCFAFFLIFFRYFCYGLVSPHIVNSNRVRRSLSFQLFLFASLKARRTATKMTRRVRYSRRKNK